MALIEISKIIDAARSRGFKVNGHSSYAEVFAPEHNGPETVWNFDSQYSTCFASLYDRPRCGYGYNDWFNGPWHKGRIQSDDSSVTRLLAHPAMAGVVL
jgi:hypothetical protein